MSKDLDDFKEIKREQADLERMIQNYQKRNEELNMKEAFLIRKMKTLEPELINLDKFYEETQNQENYILVDPAIEILKAIELPQNKLQSMTTLREEVLRKQYENLQLEKEVRARKEEQQQYSDMISRRRSAMSHVSSEDYQNLNERSDTGINANQATESTENQADEETRFWEDFNDKYNL